MSSAAVAGEIWRDVFCQGCLIRGRRIKLARLAPGAVLERKPEAGLAEVKCKDCKTPYYVHQAAAVRQ